MMSYSLFWKIRKNHSLKYFQDILHLKHMFPDVALDEHRDFNLLEVANRKAVSKFAELNYYEIYPETLMLKQKKIDKKTIKLCLCCTLYNEIKITA